MKRREFFKAGVAGAMTAGLAPFSANASSDCSPLNSRNHDQWFDMSQGQFRRPDRRQTRQYDVAVIGGGLAGICAAVAAARNGAKVVLVQDRPVLGGNSSSEMRVHVHGVSFLRPDGKPERETGIIEEILLLNRFMNQQESFPVWDHVLYEFVTREPNIELMLNTQALRAYVSGNVIKSATCWQATTETEFEIKAKQFIDCSGDGLLAAQAGAQYRTGREGKKEFNEQYAPDQADGWQMGATLLMSSVDMGQPMPFEPPSYTIKYEAEKSNKRRKFAGYENGIWWIEVGSDDDIIAEFEKNRHTLMGYLYGVWDYIKNSGKFPEAENMALDWVQSLPGRRESRRFIGDYILSEPDLLNHKHFDDAVAYGGWSLDEHNPGGIENLNDPPSFFHAHFHQVYQIPYRSLYSKNINNLLFAGRNISQTHIALSSSRVMGTCSLMGQAVGTAAAICVANDVSPRQIYTDYLTQLQENLLRDDLYIPKRPANDEADLARQAAIIVASSTSTGDAQLLTNGISRDIDGQVNHWMSRGLPADVVFEWQQPVELSNVEIKCDTNTKRNIMMLKESKNDDVFINAVPPELLKQLQLEARVNGRWQRLAVVTNNRTRLIKFTFEPLTTTAIRIRLEQTYGAPNGKLFEVRAYQA
ncbi:hypothetical protein GCM10011369_30270 [Neiella marina]|uniref:FAD-dependent oxidoreductase n=1 Tax=Neiella marina TaxID=508461 RepID=A0A8J2XQS0_9GAMM|nr:FAD-dependent oxidoreductase [Neiella marina]GGA86159.1 hypothetical protein GCM10011369_30270 [Neiella marina]